MTDTLERADALIAKMGVDRGYIRPEWELAAQEDPGFLEAYNNLYRTALMDGQELPAKYRELVALGILAFRNRSEGVQNHIKRAVRLGATKREILEAIETMVIPGGAPTMHCALAGMVEVFKELEGKQTHGD